MKISLFSLVPFLIGSMVCVTRSSGDDVDLGLGKMAPVLVCTACQRIMARLGLDLTRKIQKNTRWTSLLKSSVTKTVRTSCANEEDFPPNNEIFRKGCSVFMAKYHKAVISEIKKHLDPLAEEFEEDIEAKEFCTAIRACASGIKSIDEHMNSNPPAKMSSEQKRPPAPTEL
jgi:hypothetical protein